MSKVVKSIAGAVKKALTKDLSAKAVKADAVNKTESVKKAADKSAVQKKEPVIGDKVYRRIEEKAYELYVARGCHHGKSLEDWYEAEAMVKDEIRRGL